MISDSIAVLLPLYHALQRFSLLNGLDVVLLLAAVQQAAQQGPHPLRRRHSCLCLLHAFLLRIIVKVQDKLAVSFGKQFRLRPDFLPLVLLLALLEGTMRLFFLILVVGEGEEELVLAGIFTEDVGL